MIREAMKDMPQCRVCVEVEGGVVGFPGFDFDSGVFRIMSLGGVSLFKAVMISHAALHALAEHDAGYAMLAEKSAHTEQ